MIGCGKNTPEPPSVTPTPVENVTGAERLGWTQAAADSAELSTFRYAVYLDGVRSELTGVSCQPPSSPTSPTFDCIAPLPTMAAGAHIIELAAFIVDGDVLESARSAPMQVNKTAATTSAAPTPGPAAAWPDGMTVRTSEGLRLRLDRIAEGLVNPTDIAFAPDGRVFVAEESGRIRVLMPDGTLLAESALSIGQSQSADTRLLALGVDSGPFLYAIYATASSEGAMFFTLARFREASNAFFGRIVLLDGIPASPRSAAALRVGADGKLFAAFDDGGDPRRSGDLASPNGKVLRLNPDGTTPDDQAGFQPTYFSPLRSPRGLGLEPASNTLWIADGVSENSGSLIAVGAGHDARKRGVKLASYSLPRGTKPSSVAFYRGALIPEFRGDLLVASDEGRHLLRVRFDRTLPSSVVSTERLLQNAIGGLRVVAVGPDGRIYLATADSIATLVAAGR